MTSLTDVRPGDRISIRRDMGDHTVTYVGVVLDEWADWSLSGEITLEHIGPVDYDPGVTIQTIRRQTK